MDSLTLKNLVEWTGSQYGGVIVNFSPKAFQTICYFLREFAVPTDDPFEQLGAFRSGNYLVVGTRAFRDDVWAAFGLSRRL
jgi:hypothetical protein